MRAKTISRLVALLLLYLLVFDAAHDVLDLRHHLQRALVLECTWVGMEEQVLEEEGVLEETLERFRERDSQPGFTLFGRVLLELLQYLADLLPFRRVLLLWLFVEWLDSAASTCSRARSRCSTYVA